MNLGAVILAGGGSRRMGRDKAWLEIGGRSLILRAVSMVRELGLAEIFISGRAGVDYSALGCPVLRDRVPGSGPLGGIEAALEVVQAPLLLVLAVDLPNMTTAFLGRLAGQCDPLTGVVPQLAGALEPLAAIYPRRCGAILRRRLAEDRRSAREFAKACVLERAVQIVDVQPQEAPYFANWNAVSDIASGGFPQVT